MHTLILVFKALLGLWAASWFALAITAVCLLRPRAGVLYALAQLLSTWIATPLGWVLLIYPCLAQRWTGANFPSIKPLPDRANVDEWHSSFLQMVFGNMEDGVSGQQARIWQGTPPVLGPYMPKASAWWRAYCWSALRNSADQLKYVFAWESGPRADGTWFLGRPYTIGWKSENGHNVLVCDL